MWETAKNLVRGPTEFEGTFVVPEPILDGIKTHAAKRPNKETGGMLFGKIEESELGIKIVVEVVHNISENKASNTSTYFGIEQAYASKILNQYEPDHLYLGNWHSHLGYGGPSSGDRQEVGKFFQENEARDITLDFIMDRQSKNKLKYKPIIDIYQRKRDSANQFRTLRVGHENLEIPEMDDESVVITNSKDFETDLDSQETADSIGKNSKVLGELATFLHETYDIADEDIRNYRNESYDETVILVPFSYQDEQRDRPVDVMLKVSFPDDTTDQVFIDLTSPDLEKQLTIDKIPADKINESGSLLTDHIVTAIEDQIPRLLDQPLSNVISNTNESSTGADKRWELCQN